MNVFAMHNFFDWNIKSINLAVNVSTHISTAKTVNCWKYIGIFQGLPKEIIIEKMPGIFYFCHWIWVNCSSNCFILNVMDTRYPVITNVKTWGYYCRNWNYKWVEPNIVVKLVILSHIHTEAVGALPQVYDFRLHGTKCSINTVRHLHLLLVLDIVIICYVFVTFF